MQYSVEFGRWNGRKGEAAEFSPFEIVEVLNANDVHPRPAPLFDTAEEAEAYGKREFPNWLAKEHRRLSDCNPDTYRQHAGMALQQRHEQVKRWVAMLDKPAEPAA